MRRRSPILAILGLPALVGCHRLLAPKLTYSLPPAVLAPVGSPAVSDRSEDFLATFWSVYKEASPGEEYDCYHYLRDADPRRPPGVARARKVKILEHAETMGDGLRASNGLGKTLRANSGPV